MFDRTKLQDCSTDYGDYMYHFYPRDYSRFKVEKQIREEGLEIAYEESIEQGELVILFLNEK